MRFAKAGPARHLGVPIWPDVDAVDRGRSMHQALPLGRRVFGLQCLVGFGLVATAYQGISAIA